DPNARLPGAKHLFVATGAAGVHHPLAGDRKKKGQAQKTSSKTECVRPDDHCRSVFSRLGRCAGGGWRYLLTFPDHHRGRGSQPSAFDVQSAPIRVRHVGTVSVPSVAAVPADLLSIATASEPPHANSGPA